MPAESLVPGYKLVESFGPDAEYETRPPAGNPEGRVEGGEVEEEVEYVTLEISGISDVDPNLLTSYRLIGLDTPTPFLQLSSSGTIFKGRHHKLLGTELLFTHSQDDSDPSARHISLLGTTEQRIVFSPVEIRNPALSSEASGSAAKGKTPGRESSSTPKKSKKKASLGTGGIEEVVGSLGGVDVLKPPALDEEDPDPHSGPSTRSKTTGKKDSVAQDDDDEDDDLYATDEDDVGETRNNGAVETGPRLQQMSLQTDMDDARHSMDQFIQSPTTTGISISMTSAVTVAERNAPQDRHQYGAPLANDGVLMAIDPALGGTAPPENDRTLEPRETCDK